MDMTTLMERLKGAAQFSRLLDCEIHLTAVGDPLFGSRRDRETNQMVPSRLSDYVHAFSGVIDGDDAIPDEIVPRYTASIDAALTLIPAGLFWAVGRGRTRPDEPLAGATICSAADQLNSLGEAEGESVPICICLAALEARAGVARAEGRT